jgi:hypothetical protein
MPDITMCLNKECPMRNECYRYRAIPNEYQYYSTFTPEEEKCEHFYPIEKGHRVNQKFLGKNDIN